jgi:hypothetical protein
VRKTAPAIIRAGIHRKTTPHKGTTSFRNLLLGILVDFENFWSYQAGVLLSGGKS